MGAEVPIMASSMKLFLGAFLVAAVGASMSTMPLFVWSSSNDVDRTNSVKSAISKNLKGSEVTMLYMLNEVSSHQMQQKKAALTNLQETLQRARSTSFAALPVQNVDTADITEHIRKMGVSVAHIKSTDLQAHLADHPEITSNGKPDVVMVQFPKNADLASVDMEVGAAEKAITAATTKHVGILSTSSSQEMPSATNLAQVFSNSYSELSTRYGQTALWYGTVSTLTPTLLVAILVMIFLGIMLFCAYCCILSLQTPQMFEGDQKKEFLRALNLDEK